MANMMWDPKKAMQTIIARRRGGEDMPTSHVAMKNEISKHESGEMDGRHMAAQEMIHAFEMKSPEKMKEAMGNFMDLHMNMSDEDKPSPGV